MGEQEIEYQPYSLTSVSAFSLKRINGPGTTEWLLESICEKWKGDSSFFYNFASEIMFIFQILKLMYFQRTEIDRPSRTSEIF